MAQSGLKVIKVVNLKRFMPERHADMHATDSNIIKTNFNHLTKSTNIDDDEQVQKDINVAAIKQNQSANTYNVKGTSNIRNKQLIDRSKNKVKFRSCSHTPEELCKLTEHCDPTLVKVGDTFDSRELFRHHLNDKAKSWFYYYVCRNSKKQIIEYNCICMAYTLKPRQVILRRQKKRMTACPCKIRLKCDQNTNKVVVYYVCNHHDHTLSEATFCQYPHAKYLSKNIKDEFLDLAYLGLDIDLIQKYIYSLVGLTIKRKDIWSYAYKFKRKIFHRNLTVDRRKYLKGLISRIRNTYDENARSASNEKSVGEECATEQISQGNRENGETRGIDDDISNNETEDSLLVNVFDANIDMNNADVIVQYINEKGILCDENGTPITNSSAIMQFINNYEYSIPEREMKEEQYLEEGIVFSELVENIGDEVFPFDWDSIQVINPVNERPSVICKNESFYEKPEALISSDDQIAQEMVVTAESEHNSGQGKTTTVLSDIVDNFYERSSTLETPGLYAEMENFKKYYFVDHRYIKYEGESCKNQHKKSRPRPGPAFPMSMICEEYIKAPEPSYSPTHFRCCTGHEGLLLLTDPDAILAGAKFLVHDVFLKYINERANRWYFYYSLVESGKSPEYYIYKCIYGKHRVSKNAYRAKGLRKRSKLATQCPCQIRLRRLESDPTYLTVLYSCNHHDHVLDARLFTAQPHSRRLPDHIKEEVKDLLSLGVTFDILRKYVTEETGLRIYGKYFHNVRVKMRKNNENRQFSEERLMVLTRKIKDLEALYGQKSKSQTKTSHGQANKRNQSQMEDRFTQVSLDGAPTQTQEYFEMDDIAVEICIDQTESSIQNVKKRSRLETRLQTISTHEEILLKVKKLQESVRCDSSRQSDGKVVHFR